MLTTNVIAIDLAKNVLQICYISVHGELLFNKAFSRQKAKEFIINAKPSIVAMEGCCGCHYWGQIAQEHGHDVRIINPKKVKAIWKDIKLITMMPLLLRTQLSKSALNTVVQSL